MMQVSGTILAVAGAILALWLVGGVWAMATGLRMRRQSLFQREQADRLAGLLQSAPAIPVLVRNDGHIEAPGRLANWLGRDTVPAFVSELTGEEGGLAPADREGLARDIVAAQRGARGFTRSIRAEASNRTLLVRGAPAGPELANMGAVILWIFDAKIGRAHV